MELIGFTLFVIQVLLLIGLCTLAARMAVVAVRSRFVVRLLFTPGIIVHELSHAFFCILTGAKITEVNLFAPEGGYVKHGPPQNALGQSLISMGPLIGGPLVLAAIVWLFNRSGLIVSLPMHPSLSAEYATELVYGIWHLFYNNLVPFEPLRAVLLIVFVYLLISIALTISPSGQDFSNSWMVLAALAIMAVIVIYTRPLEYSGIAEGTPVLDIVVALIMIPVSYGLGAVAIAIVLLLPFYIVRRGRR